MTLIVLIIGLIIYFIGNSKKNLTLKGMGIGFISALFIFKIPSFIEGVIRSNEWFHRLNIKQKDRQYSIVRSVIAWKHTS